MCYYKYLSDRCNCTFQPPTSSTDHCFRTLCFKNTYNEENFEYDTKCGSECPLECTSKSLKFVKKIGVFPSYNELSEINNTIHEKLADGEESPWNENDLRHGMLELNVYFKSFNYSEKTEIPKIADSDLIGTIGGTMGLFLGMSLMSLIEIIELVNQLASTIIIAILEKKRKNKS